MTIFRRRRRQTVLVTRLFRIAVATLALGVAGLVLGTIFYVMDLSRAEAWLFASLILLTVGMGCLAGAEGVRAASAPHRHISRRTTGR